MSSASASVRVEKATSDLLLGPDWTMNIDICDSINSDHWKAKDVVKAVKKRLQHKSPRVQFLALTLLETMIKNCGDYVHFQVVDRDILQEMVKIVRKKTDMQVRDKILVLLDSWQEAFGGPGGKYPQYYAAYIELKRSGVQFPQRSPDSALIFTPPVTHPPTGPGHPQVGYGMPSGSSLTLDEAMSSEMANLSLSDLDRIRGVMELLSDMLKAVSQDDKEAVKDEVIVDLVSQCRANQKKLMQLVETTGDEELLAQILTLNDDLQSLLVKHDAIASGLPLPPEASEALPAPSTPLAIPGPSTPIAPSPTVTSRFEDEEEEEDDDFTQLARRNSKYKTTQDSSSETSEQVSSAHPSNEVNAESSSCNALALPDPPAPVKTTTSKEQDMIDLLSITLSSYPSPPHTPVAPPAASTQSASPVSASPNGPTSSYNNQVPTSPYNNQIPTSPYNNAQNQPYMAHQGYVPYNSYVAPWAQPQPQYQGYTQPQSQPQHQNYAQPQPQPRPQQAQVPSSYPPPPWEATSGANPNPFMSSGYQYPSSTANNAAAYVPNQAGVPPQQYTSAGARPFNSLSPAAGTQANANSTQTRQSPSAQPYVPPYKFFEDLVDLGTADRGSADRGTKATAPQTMAGSSGQGMIGGRK